MIKKRFYFILILINTVCLHAQINNFSENDSILMIRTEKQINWDAENWNSLTYLKESNTWYNSYPRLHGIPDSLENVRLLNTYVSYRQVAYQAYKRGDLPKWFLRNLMIKWGVDTTYCTDTTIHSYINSIAGKHNNKWWYIIDTDADLDLTNEKIYQLVDSAGILKCNNKHLINFERFINGKIVKDSTWTTIKSARLEKDKEHIKYLRYSYNELVIAKLSIDKKEYIIEATSDWNSYLYDLNSLIQISINNIPIDGLEKNQLVKLGDYIYRFSDISEDGKLIKFSKVTNELISPQVGFMSPQIQGIDKNGKQVSLSDYLGNYVLVYFWNSTCSASEIYTEKYVIPTYQQYKDKDFVVLGVAFDRKKSAEEHIKKYNINWPQIITTGDDMIYDNYNLSHYPTIYLIDKEGKIILKNIENTRMCGKGKDYNPIIDQIKIYVEGTKTKPNKMYTPFGKSK